MNAALWRTRVAVLWVVVAVALSASILLYLVEPGALEEALAGEMEGTPLSAAGVQFVAMVGIPLVMAVMTLLVNGRVNGYANLVVAVPLGAFGVFAVISEVAGGEFHPHVLIAALATLIAFLIAGLSVAGLRTRASAAAAPTPAGQG